MSLYRIRHRMTSVNMLQFSRVSGVILSLIRQEKLELDTSMFLALLHLNRSCTVTDPGTEVQISS